MAILLPIPILATWLLSAAATPADLGSTLTNRIAPNIASTNAGITTNALRQPAKPGLGQVQFLNGDTLRGKLVSIDDQRQVTWTNPDVESPLEFPLGSIARVRLPANSAQQGAPAANCLLHLRNGDEVKGRIANMDDQTVRLQTWYAGELSFPRTEVLWLRPMQTDRFIYSGPTGLDGWTVSSSAQGEDPDQAWGYAQGVFFARRTGGIARDVKLPDRASIDLDAVWRDFLQLTITLYTSSLRVYQIGMAAGMQNLNVQIAPRPGNPPAPAEPQKGAGFYAVHLNQNYAYLMTVRKNGAVVNSGFDMLAGMEQKRRVHISLRTDRARKTISLLLDGKLVKTWQETEEFAGDGTAIRLVQQGQTPLNISNIQIADWNGVLDATAPVNSPRSTNDIAQLKNQDNLAGKLLGIQGNTVSFHTGFGPLQIPLERVGQIDLSSPAPRIQPQPNPASVRAHLDGQQVLTFVLKRWEPEQVLASSQAFGEAVFKPEAFSWLEFNLNRMVSTRTD